MPRHAAHNRLLTADQHRAKATAATQIRFTTLIMDAMVTGRQHRLKMPSQTLTFVHRKETIATADRVPVLDPKSGQIYGEDGE